MFRNEEQRQIRKIVEIDEELCDGCGECIPSCVEGALKIVNGKARLVSDSYCDGLGACLGHCPRGAIRIVEREASDFDEQAAKENAALDACEKSSSTPHHGSTMACGCPSTHVKQFEAGESLCNQEMARDPVHPARSYLTHWPVQIRLVPPNAPFLKNADLLIVADCVSAAYPFIHQDFIRGRVIMIGCPKFDDIQSYFEKFIEIFRTADIRSVTVLSMEVPCCGGIQRAVTQAMEASGRDIPLEQVVIGVRGTILSRKSNETVPAA